MVRFVSIILFALSTLIPVALISGCYEHSQQPRPVAAVVLEPEKTPKELIAEICPAYGVPLPLAMEVARHESNFDSTAVAYEPSTKKIALKVKKQTGSKEPLKALMTSHGIFQIMGFNAALRGVPIEELENPKLNVEFGCSLLGSHLIRYKHLPKKQQTFSALRRYNGESEKGSRYAQRVMSALERNAAKSIWNNNV